MYVKELFKGLNTKNYPSLYFEDIQPEKINKKDNQIILVKNITINSFCEHHFLPMTGKAHIAYIPNKKIIGLSKINRLVDYFARRPQLQEKLTNQIADHLTSILETEDVAVFTSLKHLCVTMRGINDHPSSTSSYSLKGKFKKEMPFKEYAFN